MTRKEGFIEVDKMLQEIGVDTTNLNNILVDSLVKRIHMKLSGFLFSFNYNDETYFYKYANSKYVDPYNELVAEELAKDYGISCIDYDLAIINSNNIEYRGVLSKNYKKENATYIRGYDLFTDACKDTRKSNTLDGIWDILEYRYHNYSNKKEIINHLIKKVVDIYLFDIITCHCDRHSSNWEIMEYENDIDIVPLFDNERILACRGDEADIALGINNDSWTDYESLWESIKEFQKVSSSEFTDIIKDKLWIIGEENLNKVFERIEKKTGYPMPEERKEFYLNNYKEHKRRLEEILVNEETKKR